MRTFDIRFFNFMLNFTCLFLLYRVYVAAWASLVEGGVDAVLGLLTAGALSGGAGSGHAGFGSWSPGL